MTDDELKDIEDRFNAALEGVRVVNRDQHVIPRLIAELRAAREALRFYARQSAGAGKHACDVSVEFQIDSGEIARKALGEE